MKDYLRIGPIGWMKMLRGRCPRCGKRFSREIATDESYTSTVPIRSGTAGARVPIPSAYTRQVRVTPLYAVCDACGFRRRRRNIKEPV